MASNNRTVTVAENEKVDLLKGISHEVPNEFMDSIINADMFEVIDNIPDESMHLIIIDPPYNLQKDYGKCKFTSMKEDAYEDYLRSWLPQVCKKLKSDGSLYLCGDWHDTASLQRVLSENLTIINRITWQREKGRGAAHNWKNGMEDIWFAVKDPKNYYFNLDAVMIKRKVIAPYKKDGKPKDWEETKEGNFRMTCPSNLWDDISVPFWSMPENTNHPTQKPEKLCAKLILASSREGDNVFDPFMGSGTTCVTAKKLNRHYLGIELNEEYCLWAVKRLQMAETNNKIQATKTESFGNVTH